MTAVYDKLGLRFLYPENWKLLDDSDSKVPHVITLETPDGSCTWAVHVYPAESDRELVLKETLSSLRETYEDLEISPSSEEYGDLEGTGVEAMFYCLDFLIKAEMHFVELPEHSLLFWAQSEDREFDKHKLVFQAISISLIRYLTNPDESDA